MPDEQLTRDQRLNALRKKLEGRRHGEPWHELARVLDRAISEEGSGRHGEDAIRRLAAEVTGLSAVVLTRYVSTLRRLNVAAEALGMPAELLLAPGFNSVEMAVRIYDRAPERGLSALKDLAEGRIGAADVRRTLMEVTGREGRGPNLRQRQLRQAGLEVDAVEKALMRAAGGFFPKDSFPARRPMLRYLGRTGFEMLTAEGARFCGVEVFAVFEAGDFEKRFAAAVLASSFFPKYYLVFSPSTPPEVVAQAVAALELFQCSWIGVLTVSTFLTLAVVRPSSGPPRPDRTAEYESLQAALALPGRG